MFKCTFDCHCFDQFCTKIDLLCRKRNNCDSEISSSKLRASFQIVYSTIYEVVTVLVVLMSIRQVPNNIMFLSGTIKILSLLGNKTRVSYRHMSKNIPCVTALHQHTLTLFFNESKFRRKKLFKFKNFESCSEGFV